MSETHDADSGLRFYRDEELFERRRAAHRALELEEELEIANAVLAAVSRCEFLGCIGPAASPLPSGACSRRDTTAALRRTRGQSRHSWGSCLPRWGASASPRAPQQSAIHAASPRSCPKTPIVVRLDR